MSNAAPRLNAVYRFAPWWVNAIAVVPIAAAILLATQVVFFGPIVGLIAVGFVVSACLVAAAAVPLLSRRMQSLLTSTHPRLALFGALTLIWVTAWILSMFVATALALGLNQLLLMQPGVSGSETGGYGPTLGVLAYSAPVLILYIAISGLVCLLPLRKSK